MADKDSDIKLNDKDSDIKILTNVNKQAFFNL